MQAPSITQIRTAIEVLQTRSDRLNAAASHSGMHLRKAHLRDRYAARIESRTTERTARINALAGQLQLWSDELNRATKQLALSCLEHATPYPD